VGQLPQPAILSEIAKNREVWVMPWLEGDWQLWHPQQRVSLIRDHILLARKQGVQGVIAVHWRTEDIKANFESFALFARNPDTVPTVDAFYERYSSRRQKLLFSQLRRGSRANGNSNPSDRCRPAPAVASWLTALIYLYNRTKLARLRYHGTRVHTACSFGARREQKAGSREATHPSSD
jgi:hypothetical protein